MPVIPALVDGELRVRPVRQRDARALERLFADNRAWLSQWEATHPSQKAAVQPTLADVRASIRSLLGQARIGAGLPYVLDVDDEIVGQLNVSAIARGSVSSAVIGYWISEAAAGRALMTRAVALVTDYCFGPVGLHRIEICVRPENLASQRVVEKLGFRFEGLRRRYIHINGVWADHFCYALVREEVPEGVFLRYLAATVPEHVSRVPDEVRAQAERPLI